MYCAVAVCVGHIWPIFYKFKGGKGVATAFGALLRVNPLIAVAAFGVLVVGVAISKRMSVGSILAAISFPVLAYFMKPEFLNFAICLAVIIVVKHSGNIIRLIKGTEPKISVLDKVREAQGGK